ncbi:branched-chain amino acid ABC transporter permease [Parasedimentitalea marina]|uniref:Branched-chain amino acid ABC transporter permease n=1 Tax=Parasedimentitalea marina TaxID=2483033 RepID=A0A3T0N8Z6_9RHOB|nr:AzlC family ABC transporter permease [Parasedimentitalea marina]AZV80451.1 branched-chain amino acid ABC transporter permease [Parasedimentitalea marina]
MKHGALAILPLAAGAALYGFAFGLLAAQVGFPWWGVALMSSFVHAGSSQIVAVEQFSGTSAVVGAALAGAALNLRYIGIVASLSELLNGLSFRMKLLTIHITGDENWALTMAERAKNPEIGASFLIGSGLVMISVWTGSTTLGAFAGATLPNLEQLGLGFAFTAAFIAMAVGLWRGPANLIPWAASFTVTICAVTLGAPKAYAIVAGAVFGLAVSHIVRSKRKLVL